MAGFLPKKPIDLDPKNDPPGVHFVEDEFQRMLEPGWGDGCLISEVRFPETMDAKFRLFLLKLKSKKTCGPQTNFVGFTTCKLLKISGQFCFFQT